MLLSPVLLLLALLVSVDSKGGFLFRQWRVGKGGKDFLLLKFRTMYRHPAGNRQITVSNKDPLITSMGVFLRRYKLDELPQLFNVLKGDMSMVGPRPEVRKYVDLYTVHQRQILKIKPGITDIASLIFDNESRMLEKVADPETFYIKRIMPLKIRFNKVYMLNISLRKYFSIIGWSLLRVSHITVARLRKSEMLCREWLYNRSI
ncbi:sugar transferase [Flavitalea sp. BT771]|nr:sugar transferase [Flavitalea sp. BT771]MDV6218471.1 sugar transferase [Flavitalea sp. BT771]